MASEAKLKVGGGGGELDIRNFDKQKKNKNIMAVVMSSPQFQCLLKRIDIHSAVIKMRSNIKFHQNIFD